MDIQDIKKEKVGLEKTLTDLVREFERKTQTTVTGLIIYSGGLTDNSLLTIETKVEI